MTQHELEGVLRQLTGELAAARADIASLLQIQKENTAGSIVSGTADLGAFEVA
jgi:hypothetical protein